MPQQHPHGMNFRDACTRVGIACQKLAAHTLYQRGQEDTMSGLMEYNGTSLRHFPAGCIELCCPAIVTHAVPSTHSCGSAAETFEARPLSPWQATSVPATLGGAGSLRACPLACGCRLRPGRYRLRHALRSLPPKPVEVSACVGRMWTFMGR